MEKAVFAAAALAGRVVLVTGASRGIGAGILEAFLKAGATVVGSATSEAGAEKITARIAELGGQGRGVVLNVNDADAGQKAVADVVEAYGRLDVHVNNAGITRDGLLMRMGADAFDRVLDVNLKGTFNTTRALTKTFMRQRGGCVINTSSMVSKYGQPSGCGYPASKFAVTGLTRSLARELARDQIRVNAVAPGVTRTDMVAALPENMIKPLIATIPLRRVGEPEDIANAFLFLASDMASYITGEILSVDGAARS